MNVERLRYLRTPPLQWSLKLRSKKSSKFLPFAALCRGTTSRQSLWGTQGCPASNHRKETNVARDLYKEKHGIKQKIICSSQASSVMVSWESKQRLLTSWEIWWEEKNWKSFVSEKRKKWTLWICSCFDGRASLGAWVWVLLLRSSILDFLWYSRQ